ncbi:hypothetical protein N7481_012868 [Penicillium waksmanii]|uniref:uncharacterized protein n=1 Tax=Penicillium waksmanii TaxID=69791 RepID=UPI00254884B3|nr:uncharacterized protein N7481_012868 [Penicillium waksmanii]KAJ5966154.1 hypothetical protein N7481_012868 [Penicillium waksmanii]
MAKSRPAGQNTRAARRAATPEDKSIAALPRADSPTTSRPSLMADRANIGVSKKKKNNSKITRAQRLRQQKGLERAEAVSDQLQIKKSKSLVRAKAIKTRSAEWEDTNRTASAFAALQQDDEDEEDEEDDEDAAMAEDKPQQKPRANVFATPTELEDADPAPVDEDDEIT